MEKSKFKMTGFSSYGCTVLPILVNFQLCFERIVLHCLELVWNFGVSPGLTVPAQWASGSVHKLSGTQIVFFPEPGIPSCCHSYLDHLICGLLQCGFHRTHPMEVLIQNAIVQGLPHYVHVIFLLCELHWLLPGKIHGARCHSYSPSWHWIW